jgi:hypothetical protein
MSNAEEEDPVRAYFRNPTIRCLPVGHEDIFGTAGGPITHAGWYVDPYCDPGCCRPSGPFPTKDAAAAWASAEAEKPSRPGDPLPPDFFADIAPYQDAEDPDGDENPSART